MRLITFYFTAAMLLFSCRSAVKNAAADRCTRYVQWFNDPANGMLQVKNIDKKKISCRISTGIYEELVAGSGTSCEERIRTIREKGRDQQPGLNFIVKITDESGELLRNIRQSPSLTHYLNTEISKDFKLLFSTDTLAPVFCHFENNLDVAPQVSFIVGFDKPLKSGEDLTLLFTDKVLTFQSQPFVFNSTQLKRIPKL